MGRAGPNTVAAALLHLAATPLNPCFASCSRRKDGCGTIPVVLYTASNSSTAGHSYFMCSSCTGSVCTWIAPSSCCKQTINMACASCCSAYAAFVHASAGDCAGCAVGKLRQHGTLLGPLPAPGLHPYGETLNHVAVPLNGVQQDWPLRRPCLQ